QCRKQHRGVSPMPNTARERITSWPTTASIPGPSKPISATSRSSTRFAIPSWRQHGSRAYSRTELLRNLAQKGGRIFANDKADPTPMTPIEGGARKRCVNLRLFAVLNILIHKPNEAAPHAFVG